MHKVGQVRADAFLIAIGPETFVEELLYRASTGTDHDEDTWDQLQRDMIDHMLKLEAVLGPRIQKYRDGEKVTITQDQHV